MNNSNMNYAKDNKLSLFLLIIRSLPDHFRGTVTYLECLNTKFKIIALILTWLKYHHTNYTLPNFNFEQTFRPKARGGGVCLYIHSSLQYKMRRDLIPTNQKHFQKFKSSSKRGEFTLHRDRQETKHNIIVGCIYRPLVTCYIILMSYLRNIMQTGKWKRNMFTLQATSIAIH